MKIMTLKLKDKGTVAIVTFAIDSEIWTLDKYTPTNSETSITNVEHELIRCLERLRHMLCKADCHRPTAASDEEDSIRFSEGPVSTS